MSKTPWTPGPWRVECGTTLIWGDCKTVDKDGYDRMGKPVAKVKHTAIWARERDVMQPQEQGANARLIAAAPEMADILDQLSCIDRHDAIAFSHLVAQADAILSRIRNEASS